MNVARWIKTAGAAVALAALASNAQAQEWKKQFPVVQMGVLSVENQGANVTRFESFQRYFKEKTGVELKIFQASDYAGVVQALSAGQIQLAALGPASYAAAFIDSSGAVEPILTNREVSGEIGYHSILIVKSDSPYKSVDDLKGKTLAWADPNSTSGYLVPLTGLKAQKIDPAKHFGRTVFSGGHEQSVLGVLNGNFDAAFTWTSKGDQMGQLRMMIDRGLLDRSKIRVIWESDLIPNPPMVVRKDMPADMRREMIALFTNMHKDNMAVAEAVARGKTSGFVEVNAAMYQPIVDVALEQRAQRRAQKP
jgi:phosphonate transport system substrate-binding protein